jgi:hypothetical protein
VTFTPTLNGTRNGAVTITDNAVGSPQTVILQGTGTPVSLSAASLTFDDQVIGASSNTQMIILTNRGISLLTITGITIIGTNSGDFSQTNTCPISPATLAAGLNCTISFTFTPTATGNRSAAVTITDNASDSPQSVSLTGTGTDFSIGVTSGGSTSATVKAGLTATYHLQLSLVGGAAPDLLMATVSCTGVPSNATCAGSPSPVTVTTTGPAALTISVGTIANGLQIPTPPSSLLRNPADHLLILWFLAILLLLVWILRRQAEARGDRSAWTVRLASPVPLLLLAMTITAFGGCGGGGSTPPPPVNNGTPPGTYMLTVSATSGNLTHTQQLTLTVQ